MGTGESCGICKNDEGDTVCGRDGGVVHLEMWSLDLLGGRVVSPTCFPVFEVAFRPSVGDVGTGGSRDF